MGASFEVLPIGPVAVAARSWRHRGRQLLTVIVKGTFDLNHEGSMTAVHPAPIATEERHYRNSPVASLVHASDLALLVPKPEVLIVGAAFAPAGRQVPATAVQLTLHRNDELLLDKRLDVVGDRRAAPGVALPDPVPFDRMPIQYERAYGGQSSRENPVGRGMAPDDDGRVSHPNVLSPAASGVAPAGFGPIPSAWPARQKLRGSLGAAAANQHLDLEVPNDFDDAYYQAAPADQRVRDLRGGELITLVNMHPEHAILRTHMSRLRCVALAQTARGERIPIVLRIDTLHLEPEQLRAEILYRGALVLEAGQLAGLRVAGALEAPEQKAVFPDLFTMQPPAAAPARAVGSHASTMLLEPPPSPPAEHRFSGTMLLEPEAPARRQVPPAPPPPGPPATHAFSGTMLIEPEAPGSGLDRGVPFAKVPSAPPPPGPQPTHAFSGTMVLEPEAPPRAPAAAQAAPFAKREVPPAPPPPGPAPTHGFAGTMMLEPDHSLPKHAPPAAPAAGPALPAAPSPAAHKFSGTMLVEAETPATQLPFAKGKRKRSGEIPAVIAGKAATPWADQKAAKAEPVRPSRSPFESTMLIEPPPAAAAATKVAPRPSLPEPPPPTEAASRDPKKSPWREDPPEAPLPQSPQQSTAAPRVDVKGSLYKKSKR